MKIVAHLQQDARKPFTSIAKELGLPESTVRKRVAKLQRLGILHFAAFADPLRLGFQYWSLIQLKVDLRVLVDIATKIAAYPEVFFVGITTGEHDLFVAAVFRSNADLLRFLAVRLLGMAGVRRSSTSNVLKIVKRRGPFFGAGDRSLTPRRSHPTPVSFDDDETPSFEIEPLDKQIIAQLQTDGRKPLAQVATALGISESSVHTRVARLKKRGALVFETFADPLQLGFQYWALMNLRVEPRRLGEIAARLVTFPELFFVGLTTGDYDVFAAGVFQSNDELLAFLTQRIARIPGITDISTMNVVKLVKRQLVYPLSNDIGTTHHQPRRTLHGPASAHPRR
jgi:Lrp/AsnC family transcriptional regulator for asnA, asnC and gidA